MEFRNGQFYGATDGKDNHPWIDINVSHGSTHIPMPVSNNEDLGGIRFNAYTGNYDQHTNSNYKPTAAIKVITSNFSKIDSNLLASDLGIYVGNNFWRQKYNFSWDGTFSAPHIQLNSYSSLEEVNDKIPNPQPGMMVYIKSESKFFGYIDRSSDGAPGWSPLNT